jgi:hypothetical protein
VAFKDHRILGDSEIKPEKTLAGIEVGGLPQSGQTATKSPPARLITQRWQRKWLQQT